MHSKNVIRLQHLLQNMRQGKIHTNEVGWTLDACKLS
jgi:hypothetical protein